MFDKEKKFTDIVKMLPKLAKYMLGISILTYVSGFIIVNLYLGSFGINNLYLFKARYIIVGTMFILFCLSYFYLSFGLNKIIQDSIDRNKKINIFQVIWFSIENFSVVYFVINFFSILETSMEQANLNFGELHEFQSLEFLIEYGKILLYIVVPFSCLLVLLYIIDIIISLIKAHSNKGNNKINQEFLIDILKRPESKRYIFKSIRLITYLVIFTFAYEIILHLLNFQTSFFFMNPHFFSTGFSYYFIGILVLYLIFVSVKIVHYKNQQQTNNNKENDWIKKNPLNPYIGRIYQIGLLLVLLIPIYSFGIYAELPQQLGGGEAIEVEIIFSDENLEDIINCGSSEIYLIDRSTDYSIFVIDPITHNDHQIIEISNSIIDMIIYK